MQFPSKIPPEDEAPAAAGVRPLLRSLDIQRFFALPRDPCYCVWVRAGLSGCAELRPAGWPFRGLGGPSQRARGSADVGGVLGDVVEDSTRCVFFFLFLFSFLFVNCSESGVCVYVYVCRLDVCSMRCSHCYSALLPQRPHPPPHPQKKKKLCEALIFCTLRPS